MFQIASSPILIDNYERLYKAMADKKNSDANNEEKTAMRIKAENEGMLIKNRRYALENDKSKEHSEIAESEILEGYTQPNNSEITIEAPSIGADGIKQPGKLKVKGKSIDIRLALIVFVLIILIACVGTSILAYFIFAK